MFQRGEQRVARGGDSSCQQPLTWDECHAMLGKPIDGSTLGRGSVPIERHDLPCCGIRDQHRYFATQGVHVRIHHTLSKNSRDRSIDGIAALAQDRGTNEGRQIMLCGDHAMRSHNGWTKGHTRTPLRREPIVESWRLSTILYWRPCETHAETAAMV